MQGRSQAACLCSVLWLSSHSLSPREDFLAKSCFPEPVALCQGLWVRGGDALLRCSGWPCLLPDDTSLPLVGTGSWQRTEDSEATSLLPIFPSFWAPTSYYDEQVLLSSWTMGGKLRFPSHPSFEVQGIVTASPEHPASCFPSAGRSFHLPFQWRLFLFLFQGTQEICCCVFYGREARPSFVGSLE